MPLQTIVEAFFIAQLFSIYLLQRLQRLFGVCDVVDEEGEFVGGGGLDAAVFGEVAGGHFHKYRLELRGMYESFLRDKVAKHLAALH